MPLFGGQVTGETCSGVSDSVSVHCICIIVRVSIRVDVVSWSHLHQPRNLAVDYLLDLPSIVLVAVTVHEGVKVVAGHHQNCCHQFYECLHVLSVLEHYGVVREVGHDKEATDETPDFSHSYLVVNSGGFVAGGVDAGGALHQLDHDEGVAGHSDRQTGDYFAGELEDEELTTWRGFVS